MSVNIDFGIFQLYNNSASMQKQKRNKEQPMKTNYIKTILYSFPQIEKVQNQIDEVIKNKAMASMEDNSPCDEQCEKILNLLAQKVILDDIKRKIKLLNRGLTDNEKDLLAYKYFKNKPYSYFIDKDVSSRNYFRKQANVLKKISDIFEMMGLNDKWFEEKCLTTPYFEQQLKRVEESERIRNANSKRKKRNKDASKIHKQTNRGLEVIKEMKRKEKELRLIA